MLVVFVDDDDEVIVMVVVVVAAVIDNLFQFMLYQLDVDIIPVCDWNCITN